MGFATSDPLPPTWRSNKPSVINHLALARDDASTRAEG